ncbi:MAG: hypothetical protein ACYCZ0_04845 [Minisyncoccota bacterium]
MTPAYSEDFRPLIRQLQDSLEALVAKFAESEKTLTVQERIVLLYQTRKNREVLVALELLMLASLQLREIGTVVDIQKNAGVDTTLAVRYVAQLDEQCQRLQALMLELPTSESLHGLVKRVLPDAELDTPTG